MFKVGDKVVRLDLDSPHIYSIMRIEDGVFTIGRKVRHRTWGTWLECSEIRLASPEEIESGHRIESSNDQAISDCSFSNLCQNDTQNSLLIKQENQDVGDDSHIENHVSPNCKKFDERVNGNETN